MLHNGGMNNKKDITTEEKIQIIQDLGKELLKSIKKETKFYENLNKTMDDIRKKEFAGMTMYDVTVEAFI